MLPAPKKKGNDGFQYRDADNWEGGIAFSAVTAACGERYLSTS